MPGFVVISTSILVKVESLIVAKQCFVVAVGVGGGVVGTVELRKEFRNEDASRSLSIILAKVPIDDTDVDAIRQANLQFSLSYRTT